MRNQLLLWIFLLLGSAAQAQEGQAALIVSTQGKVKYLAASTQKASKAVPGAVLKMDGRLKLGKNARVLLYGNERYVTISQPGTYSIQKVCAETGTQTLGFEYDLGEYLVEAASFAAFANNQNFYWIKPIAKTGDGWSSGMPGSKGGSSGWGTGMPGSKGGSSGWGTGMPGSKGGSSGWGTGMPGSKGGSSGWGTLYDGVLPIMPFGKIAPQPTTFYWSNPKKATTFKLVIQDEANNTVFEKLVRDTFLVVDISNLKLTPGIKYRWTIGLDDNAVRVLDMLFEVVEAENQRQVLQKVSASAVIQDAQNPSLTYVAEAVALEKARWFYAAQEKYAAVSRLHPNNLTKMAHAAFWWRYGYLPLVEKAAQ
jgi:hypothetical protein